MMPHSSGEGNALTSVPDSFDAQGENIIAILDRALELPPLDMITELAQAERAVARMRDGVIERVHLGGAADDTEQWRTVLERLNVVLTLILSVEYPAGAIQRKPVEQSRDLLKSLLDDAPR